MHVHAIAPSGPFEQEPYEQGCNRLHQEGFLINHHAQKRNNPSHPYLNGIDGDRLSDIQNAFLNPKGSVIWLARGGYGITRLLPLLHRQRPPFQSIPFVGFSDGCALLSYLYQIHGMRGIHGPVINSLYNEDSTIFHAVRALLHQQKSQVPYPPLHVLHHDPTTPVELELPLFAYNLCILCHLVQTPFLPPLSNCILAIEEVNEQPYRIDRMLTYLHTLGALRHVRAVLLGHFSQCLDPQKTNPVHVAVERLQAAGIPLIAQLPFGHELPNWPLLFGGQYAIRIGGSQGTLAWKGY